VNLGDGDIKITKGGEIMMTVWNSEAGEFYTENKTSKLSKLLTSNCYLDNDVILRDLFLLAEKHEAFLSLIMPRGFNELVHEGLHVPTEKKASEIDHLELYWDLRITQEFSEKEDKFLEVPRILSGGLFPQFHGWGTWLADEFIKEGTKGGYAISLTPANELINLPLKLGQKGTVYDEEHHKVEVTPGKVLLEYDEVHYSLFHILYGVFWELSWHGTPSQRNSRVAELKEAIKEVKEELDKKKDD